MLGLKTQSGNLLVTNGKKTAYVTSDLKLLREATWSEFRWLASTILYDYDLQENDTFDDFLLLLKENDERVVQITDETVLDLLPEDFEIIELSSEIVDEDYRNYDSSRSRNGGCYGFWTTRHYVKLIRGEQVLFAWYDSYHTTADFSYCSGCGEFNQHGYEKGTVKQGDKIIGLTKQEFEHGREIYIY